MHELKLLGTATDKCESPPYVHLVIEATLVLVRNKMVSQSRFNSELLLEIH